MQNLSNIIVFQNYETFNNLAHGQFMEWLKKIEFSQTVANQFMKVSKNIKQPTSVDLGINALYLIATLPEEEILSYFFKKAYNANSKSV